MICPLSLAHFFALTAFQIFIPLLFIDMTLAPVPLVLFVLICVVVPFFPRVSFFLPITSRGTKGARGVALTFDDGPDPEVTPKLLELLARHQVPATFFVTGIRAERYPEIVNSILAAGHLVGNHSYSHFPFLMLKGRRTLRREIETAQEVLKQFGIVPLAFRPPVGVTNSRLWRILLENGMFCCNFSRRAADMGNRRVKGLAARLLAKATHGDIVLLHDISPRQGDVAQLLREFSTLIEGLRGKGIDIVPLDRLIGKEVMQQSASGPNAAELFYNNLAATYDQEQFGSKVSMSRTLEHRLFSERVPSLFAGARRVLEIGAGTGIFTLDIARNCREAVALDISGNMLELLKQKAESEGIDNITVMKANAEEVDLPGRFSVVCAFSALEYITDLPALVQKLSRQMEPGGRVYFITARTSLFRFFTQIGNAMRQGIWLRARSRREMEAMLTAAGFEQIEISSHLLKCIINGGMLLEVAARKKGEAAVAAGPTCQAGVAA